MDLEQRVRALEQELQILKAQIQTTLLDIQEQLLTNAHPTLRSGDALPLNGQIDGQENANNNGRPAQPTANTSRAPEQPIVRRFTLTDEGTPQPADDPVSHTLKTRETASFEPSTKSQTVLAQISQPTAQKSQRLSVNLPLQPTIMDPMTVAPPAVNPPAEPMAEIKPRKNKNQNDHRNIVLRLIAGVLNADVNMKWGKHHG